MEAGSLAAGHRKEGSSWWQVSSNVMKESLRSAELLKLLSQDGGTLTLLVAGGLDLVSGRKELEGS